MATASDKPTDVTGIYGEFDAGKTTALAQKLRPKTNNLIVISGASEMARQWPGSVRAQIQPYEEHLLSIGVRNVENVAAHRLENLIHDRQAELRGRSLFPSPRKGAKSVDVCGASCVEQWYC